MPRPSVRRWGILAAGAAVVVGPFAGPTFAAPSAVPVTIDLVAANDFHGRLETSGAVGGAAVLAGAANQFREENPNTLFVGAGDFIGASTFTSFIQDDNPTIDALNAAGLDVSSVGNHEYDQGWADLRDDVIGGADGHPADWPYLAANVVLDATGEPAPETPPYWTTETGGITVGFVGAVTEDLPSLVSPAGIADLEVLAIIESVNAVADALSDGDEANGEADLVVLLVHEDAQGAIAEGANANIDAIVSGHTHETYAFFDDSGRPVVQTGQYATNIGHISLVVDDVTGEVMSSTVENHPLMTCDSSGVCTPNYEPDPEVQAIVDAAVEEAEELGAEPLGLITENVTRSFDIRYDEDAEQWVFGEDRGEESTLGNLVADAQRWATTDLPTGEAQIAFMNPGGLRADLCYEQADYPYEEVPDAPDVDVVCSGVSDDGGLITYRDAATVQPFANTLVRMSLTGAQIESVLEQQLQPPDASRPFLHLGVSSGFEYTYDLTLDDAGVPTAFDVTGMTLHGTAIDPAASYEIVVNSFLAAGGDNFPTFAEGADKQDTGEVDLSTFVDFMAEFSPVSPDLQERALDSATLGDVRIEWPTALGDPPSIGAGTSRRFSLVTDLPLALPEAFALTADLPDGITMREPLSELGNGIPAGEQSLPFQITVDEDVAEGTYELVFTLDRTGDYSVFDGNPIATPKTITVELLVVSTLPPTGLTSAWMSVIGLGAIVLGVFFVVLAARRERRLVRATVI